jgi:uncharacterized membrane protein
VNTKKLRLFETVHNNCCKWQRIERIHNCIVHFKIVFLLTCFNRNISKSNTTLRMWVWRSERVIQDREVTFFFESEIIR